MTASRDAAALIGHAIAERLAVRRQDRPVVVGICGAQGSGKSTVTRTLADGLEAAGRRTAVLSLDDLYLSRAAREQMARTVHPLFRTRGVPGTHDVPLGLAVFASLLGGKQVALPRFDKAADTVMDRRRWQPVDGSVEVVLFEGWCVGAVPEPAAALDEPVNALERDDDADMLWRRTANDRLAGDYQELFDCLDLLVLLAAPGFHVVADWRRQQERELCARTGRRGMTDRDIDRFILFYERISRHILRTMPDYADLTLYLDERRAVTDVAVAGATFAGASHAG